MKKSKDSIKNELQIVKPRFSITLKTNENLEKAVKTLEKLMNKYER